MNSVREWAIRTGQLRPAARQALTSGDPSPADWIDKPTLRLDGTAMRAIRREREYLGSG